MLGSSIRASLKPATLSLMKQPHLCNFCSDTRRFSRHPDSCPMIGHEVAPRGRDFSEIDSKMSILDLEEGASIIMSG
jgi:hypothetical protein